MSSCNSCLLAGTNDGQAPQPGHHEVIKETKDGLQTVGVPSAHDGHDSPIVWVGHSAMRMIPSRIMSSTQSNAERHLFEQFSALQWGAASVCLHSLDLPDHEYKAMGEIDFIVIGPRGLYVIEVKGGGIRCVNGIWEFENRWGQINRSSEGPFRQARSAMFSLRQRLANLIAQLDVSIPFSERDLASLTMGYGVAFPDCDFDIRGAEFPHEIVFDYHRMQTDGLGRYLGILDDYWHAKFPDKPSRANEKLVSRVVTLLRPDFELARSLQVESDRIEGRLVRMTEEQYSRLDIIEHCPRILVSGGAGTGKTFLAIEVARRHAAAGERTLLVCFSPLLAGFLEGRCQPQPVVVSSVHEVMLSVVRRHGMPPAGFADNRPLTDPWYLHTLVPAFETASRNLADGELFDVLIVDEGQDILNLDYLTALGRMLRGGLEQGRWRIFYDPFNQGPIFGSMDSQVVDLLAEIATVPARLNINCRNTDEVVLQTKLMTGADLGSQSTGPGPKVDYHFYRDRSHAAALLHKRLVHLDSHQVPMQDVTILSPLPFEQSTASLLRPRWRNQLTVYDGRTPARYPPHHISFSTIATFKGLENRFILLCDIDALDDTPLDRANLYVGMSRARVALWVAIHESQKHRQVEVTMRNIVEAVGDNERHG